MKVNGELAEQVQTGQSAEPAFQVIILGSGGGPNEDNVTGLLVRSTATKWAKGSLLAVDAGTHLSAITRVLENSPDVSQGTANATGSRPSRPKNGVSHASTPPRPTNSASETPFSGLALPNETARANAAYITRELVSTYLITHAHLDHLAGFVINTASFTHTSRPKRLAALPSTIDAIKTHIFNDLIWPNLSDEDGGVGFVSYMRLTEGGNIALGQGDGRGYIEVCDGLGVKSWSVSHGTCTKRHNHSGAPTPHHPHSDFNSPGGDLSRRVSTNSDRRSSSAHLNPPDNSHNHCIIDSTAFFIRDSSTGHELLIFGDVEPDSLSLTPRNERVWHEAAPKIAQGQLGGIIIECSYDDSQSDETLFGHLAPRHLIRELAVLADKVAALRTPPSLALTNNNDDPTINDDIAARRKRKRERESNGSRMSIDSEPPRRFRSSQRGPGPVGPLDRAVSPAAAADDDNPNAKRSSSVSSLRRASSASSSRARKLSVSHARAKPAPASASSSGNPAAAPLPLQDLKVIIIHVKDTLRDGPPAEETILAQLQAYEEEWGLGVEFIVGARGGGYFL